MGAKALLMVLKMKQKITDVAEKEEDVVTPLKWPEPRT
jgi:hypothetical protein